MSLRDKIKTINGGQAIPDDVIVNGQAGGRQGVDIPNTPEEGMEARAVGFRRGGVGTAIPNTQEQPQGRVGELPNDLPTANAPRISSVQGVSIGEQEPQSPNGGVPDLFPYQGKTRGGKQARGSRNPDQQPDEKPQQARTDKRMPAPGGMLYEPTRGFAPKSREEDRPTDTAAAKTAEQTKKPEYVADKKDPFKSVAKWLAKPTMSNKSKERMLIAMEAMRHLANLYYTNKGARPQNLNYNAVLDWETRQKAHKKEAEAKEALEAKKEADAAKDKWNKDIAMAKLSLQSRDLDGKAAARAAKAENDGKRLALDAEYKSGQLTLGAERNKNTANHNKAMEGNARQRNAIAARNAATRAARSSGGGSGGSGGGGSTKNGNEYIRGGKGTWYIGNKDKRKKLAAETYDMLIKEIPDAAIMEGDAASGMARKRYPTEQEMWEVIQHYPSSKAYKHMVKAAGAVIQGEKDNIKNF